MSAIIRIIGKIRVKSFGGNSTSSGFSTLELLIATAMLTMVVGAVATLINNIQKGEIAQEDLSAVQQNERYAMDSILRAVRQAGNDPNGLGFAKFDLDPDGDGIYNSLRVRSD